jgi:hypothetical protein
MLNAILQFFSLRKPPEPAKRPLSLGTVYGANQKAEPFFLDPNWLEKQKKVLQKESPDDAIETVTLDSNVALISLIKHKQPILRSVFMYPAGIHETQEWEALKHEAARLNTGIALFRPLHVINCLKVIKKNASVSYLIDHRAITRVRSLWHS